MNLLLSLRSELLKTKRTASLYLTFIGAAAVPVIFLLNVLLDGLDDTRKDPLNRIFKLNAEMNGIVFFPMFVILICTLLPQVEFRNNTWKQVLTTPQAKANVFLAKFLNIHLLIVLFLTANIVFMFLTLFAVNFIDPTLNLFQQPLNMKTVLINTANSYTTALAICTIQFWIGLRFKNFIAPIATGIALWLTGTMLTFNFNSSLAIYFPYSFHTFTLYPKVKASLNQVAWTSAAYAVLILFAGYFDFSKKAINK